MNLFVELLFILISILSGFLFSVLSKVNTHSLLFNHNLFNDNQVSKLLRYLFIIFCTYIYGFTSLMIIVSSVYNNLTPLCSSDNKLFMYKKKSNDSNIVPYGTPAKKFTFVTMILLILQ